MLDTRRVLDVVGHMLTVHMQRQTVVSQFFQLDRLVVEGGKTGKQKDGNDIIRVKDQGYVSMKCSWPKRDDVKLTLRRWD